MENGIIHYIEKNYTNDKIDHIGYYIRSRIKESKQLSPEHKETLLNFPVIYIHTWTKDEKKYVYVGETINLVRRIDENGIKKIELEARESTSYALLNNALVRRYLAKKGYTLIEYDDTELFGDSEITHLISLEKISE